MVVVKTKPQQCNKIVYSLPESDYRETNFITTYDHQQ